MTRPRATGALIIVLLLWCSSCTSDAAERQARPATVALGTWVGGLCAALERFGQETRIGAADDASLPTPNASHAETVSALQHLTTTVEALGVPAVEDGRALQADIVHRLRSSRSMAEDGPPANSQVVPGGVRSAQLTLAYPFGLYLLLRSGRSGFAKAAILLDEPVRIATVSRLTDLLRKRSDVADIRYETEAEACRRFRTVFADQPTLVDDIECHSLPASLRVTLTANAAPDELHDSFIDRDGVDDVIVQPPMADIVEDMTGLGSDEMGALGPIRDAAENERACAPPV